MNYAHEALEDIFRYRGKGKFDKFPSRLECWERENGFLTLYREHGDEDAYMKLLHLMMPAIRSVTYGYKFTDVEEFKLVAIEEFHKAVITYEMSPNPKDMLFSGYYRMNLRFAVLNHLNYYVEDRDVVKPLEKFSYGLTIETFDEGEITDFRFYLALDKLTKRERQVITMYFFEGKGEVEIIEELGIKESSFPVYLSKSKKAFREAYTEVLELDLLQLSDEEMEL